MVIPGHAPAPSQFAARVAVPAVQLALRQPLVGYVQADVSTPLQVPPQDEPSVAQAVRLPRGAPVVGVHVPTLPELSHAWHWPVHEELQQTPSVH